MTAPVNVERSIPVDLARTWQWWVRILTEREPIPQEWGDRVSGLPSEFAVLKIYLAGHGTKLRRNAFWTEGNRYVSPTLYLPDLLEAIQIDISNSSLRVTPWSTEVRLKTPRNSHEMLLFVTQTSFIVPFDYVIPFD